MKSVATGYGDRIYQQLLAQARTNFDWRIYLCHAKKGIKSWLLSNVAKLGSKPAQQYKSVHLLLCIFAINNLNVHTP